MKTIITVFALALASMISSCASHCGASEWRKRRFVENDLKPIPVTVKSEYKKTV